MKLILRKPDIYGAIVSNLCVIHCVATPFIFVAHTSSLNEHISTPIWWSYLDYVFLTISFFAVSRSTKNTGKSYMKPLLWINWSALLFLILNEKYQLLSLPETVTYITAFSLASLHIYNLKYCQCKNNKCCTQNG
ncbi:MerC mercury resistance protein [Zobellia uliginosa]|uniref:MerC mercury resistance protein n=1 Tax=Zobellia uliginosa TaxID=143224 RepID=A0ABY1KL48_9FLAO|nr:MerC domain-containing protein [Zobellia uliginosa]SIS47001.1 MerC mercury resistance protein [Zobellia uliginosa]